MLDQATQGQLASHIDTAQTIVIAIPGKASRDVVAAAAGLAQSLLAHQKVVRFVTPQLEKAQAEQGLTGLELLQNELGNQNLSISFPYLAEQVDKVSYHIGEETNRFYLTIKPKAGTQPINHSEVEFAYTGTAADLFILIGVNALEDLEQLYYGYEEAYKDTPIISLHSHTVAFAAVSIDAGSQSSLSEALAEVLQALELPLSADTATNLLSGIEVATRRFASYAATADTFAVVSSLLKAGARRLRVEEGQTAVSPQPPRQPVAPEKKGSRLDGVTLPQRKKNSLPVEFTPGATSKV